MWTFDGCMVIFSYQQETDWETTSLPDEAKKIIKNNLHHHNFSTINNQQAEQAKHKNKPKRNLL